MVFDLLSSQHTAPAECIIRIDGDEIAHLYPMLTEVSVSTNRLNGAEGQLKFETRRDENGTWLIQDDPAMRPWAEIEVLARFGDTDEEIVRGHIKKLASQYPSDAGTASVTVDFQDGSLLLDRTHRRTTWGADSSTDDLTIIREMLTGTGLSLHGDSAGESATQLNQNSTDIRFLRTRAQSIGREIIFREDELYFGPMRLDGDPQATIMVYAGPHSNCIHFSLDDDGHRPDEVQFDVAAAEGSESEPSSVSPDLPLLGNEPVGSSSSGLNPFSWRLDREGESNETHLLAIAQARANENSLKIRVSGELCGSLYGHVLLPGETVGVDGVGDRHNGIYYVDTVRHVFSDQGYRQSFQLLRNAYGDNLPSGPPNPLSGL